MRIGGARGLVMLGDPADSSGSLSPSNNGSEARWPDTLPLRHEANRRSLRLPKLHRHSEETAKMFKDESLVAALFCKPRFRQRVRGEELEQQTADLLASTGAGMHAVGNEVATVPNETVDLSAANPVRPEIRTPEEQR